MYGEADEGSWLTEALEREGDANLPVPGEAELADSEGSSESWNNGSSVPVPSESEYTGHRLSSVGSGIEIPHQDGPGQIVAGLGSADGSQVAIEAP